MAGQGQLRAYRPRENEFIPLWIEIGSDVPENENPLLGKRLLSFIDDYQNQMVFPQTHLVQLYKSTSWVTTQLEIFETSSQPIYQDAEVAAFDVPIEGAQYFGYPWPEKYFRMKSPKAKHNQKPPE